MIETIVRVAWALLALVHLMPAVALFRPSLITRLYGVDPSAPAFLLLQHRAGLFLIVMLAAIWAFFVPEVRRLAGTAVAISMLSFLLLYAQAGMPSALKSIALADMIALPALLFVLWAAFLSHN